METSGSIVCVGLGMMLGAHISPRSRSHIEQADVVFAAVSDPLIELWLQEMHKDVRSLQPFYKEGKSRHGTYREMVKAMMVEVRSGKRVCGAFYGHPGVFARAPHAVIEQARSEGFDAHMEPGISAEDCLYADLGIDPGRYGCQHYEASQFMFYRRPIDPSAYLILWQVGIAGDRSFQRYATESAYRQLLVDLLVENYPPEHGVIIYEAATLPIITPRIQKLALKELANTQLHLQSTMVLPPCQAMQRNEAMLARIEELDRVLNSDSTAAPTQQ
jgi:uncharacterized protein YabN with tetrapyrrole methylase and pyrophosphatase domain